MNPADRKELRVALADIDAAVDSLRQARYTLWVALSPNDRTAQLALSLSQQRHNLAQAVALDKRRVLSETRQDKGLEPKG